MAASRKDMRRTDLIIPFVEPEKDAKDADMSSTISSTMPMMAMFTRNKMIGWVAVVFALQTWMQETEESRKTAQTPGYFSVLMSLLGLGTTYMQYVLPPQAPKGGSSTAAAQSPKPPS